MGLGSEDASCVEVRDCGVRLGRYCPIILLGTACGSAVQVLSRLFLCRLRNISANVLVVQILECALVFASWLMYLFSSHSNLVKRGFVGSGKKL